MIYLKKKYKKVEKVKFDFKPLGNSIKNNRNSKDLTQEKVAEILDLELPYYSRIENSGQHPSLQVLYELVQLLNVSLDEHFLPKKKSFKSSKRRVIDELLDEFSDSELEIIEGTANGIKRSKEK